MRKQKKNKININMYSGNLRCSLKWFNSGSHDCTIPLIYVFSEDILVVEI